MNSLNLVPDAEPSRGDFDPADSSQLARLMRAATIRYGERLALLPPSQRQEVLDEAKFAAVESALSHDPATAKTTKWKTAANRANTVVRKFFRERPRKPQNETDVLERIRKHSHAGEGDPESDAGELDLTVLAADDDDEDYVDDDDGLSDAEYDAIAQEEQALLDAYDSEGDAREQVEPTEEELNPLERAHDEDAEHFEMRRHLLSQASEPDRTVLQNWTRSATEVGQMIGMSGDAVRQRKTRLRRLIESEIARPEPLGPAADS